MNSLKLDLLMYFFLNFIDSFFFLIKSLRCQNSNETRSSFSILLFIASVAQSDHDIHILLICGLINGYFSFLSRSLFLNRNLMKIKGFLSKQSGARDLRARG